MVSKFKESDARKFSFLCSRRLGKSFTLSVLALETAIKAPRTKVLVVTQTYKAATQIFLPLMNKLLDTCPKVLKPEFRVQAGMFVFPNGSQILLFGGDRNPDALRGQEASLILLDEAAFLDNFEYLLGSVLMPMCLTTNGRILSATTPPRMLDHGWTEFHGECEIASATCKLTIYDNPRLTPDLIEEYMAEAGGKDSLEWRREYLCELIPNDNLQVFPEFVETLAKELVQETPPAGKNDRYVSLDLGFQDFTAAVFGYYDFEKAVLVIEDEFIINRANTLQIAEGIKRVEQRVWQSKTPYKRVSDTNNPQLIYDLNSLHGLSFSQANKEAGKEPMINKLRLALLSKQVLINPRCVNLISHLKYCRWKSQDRLTFERSKTYGHFDAADALIMLWSSINRNHAPDRHSYDITKQYWAHIPSQQGVHPLESLTKKSNKIITRRSWSR